MMTKAVALGVLLIALPNVSFAQSYSAPAPTNVPTTGTRFLSKADRKAACTGVADRRGMKGLSRQQYRAACRGRQIPKS